MSNVPGVRQHVGRHLAVAVLDCLAVPGCFVCDDGCGAVSFPGAFPVAVPWTVFIPARIRLAGSGGASGGDSISGALPGRATFRPAQDIDFTAPSRDNLPAAGGTPCQLLIPYRRGCQVEGTCLRRRVPGKLGGPQSPNN